MAKAMQLKQDKRNYRKHSERNKELIRKSIDEAGFGRSVVVDADDVLVCGNGVQSVIDPDTPTRIIETDGSELIVVKRTDLHEGDERRKRLAMADNAAADHVEWDFDNLLEDWPDIDLNADWDIDVERQVTPDEVKEEPKAVEEDEFDEQKDSVPTVCALGDVWLLGEHRLMCGDSTKAENLKALLQDDAPDAIFTDPPYGIHIDGQKKSVCNNPKHNRKEHEFRGWDNERPSKELFDLILSFNVPTCIFGGNYFADLLPASRGWLYWSKGQDGLTMSDGELAWTNMSKPLRCVTVNRAALQGSVHPTQKPLQVVEFGIRYLDAKDKENDIVLDCFGGSGSTLIACEQLGRKARLMELDPHYCDVIIARWEKLTGKKAVKERLHHGG